MLKNFIRFIAFASIPIFINSTTQYYYYTRRREIFTLQILYEDEMIIKNIQIDKRSNFVMENFSIILIISMYNAKKESNKKSCIYNIMRQYSKEIIKDMTNHKNGKKHRLKESGRGIFLSYSLAFNI